MAREGLIDEKTAVLRVPAGDLDQLLHKMIDPKAKLNVLTHGIDASPGAKFNDGTPLASGKAFGSPVWQSDPQAAVGADLLVNSGDIAGTEAADGWLRNHNGRQYRVRRSVSDPGKYEFVPVDQLRKCVGILRLAIERFCV